LRFKALADRSNLLDTDLLERFKVSLDPVVLMRMAKVHSDKKTFGPYTKAAIQLNNEHCNAENIICISNGKEPRYSGASKSADSHAATHHKEKDSDAMDVDAVFLGIAASILTKEQNQQWRLKMKDRCYACGSKDHRSKDCRFCKDHTKCGHCEGEGHTQAVCLHRYAGMPAGPAPKRTCNPKCRAAVTRIEEVSDSESKDDFDLGVSTAKPETNPAACHPRCLHGRPKEAQDAQEGLDCGRQGEPSHPGCLYFHQGRIQHNLGQRPSVVGSQDCMPREAQRRAPQGQP
jgi:hypothetical protein